MDYNELKNRIQKNVKEDIAISNIRKELNMERGKNKKILYGILSSCAVFILCGVTIINYHHINTNDIVNEQAKLENIENMKTGDELKIQLNINQIKDGMMTRLDVDIQTLNNIFIPYFEFLKEIKIPVDFDNTNQYSVWTRGSKTGDYDILNNYEFYYSNTKDNRNIKLSFSDKYQPIRDYYFGDDGVKSIIEDCELVICQYENSYMTTFTYHNVNFDIETQNITQEELIDLLKSVIIGLQEYEYKS